MFAFPLRHLECHFPLIDDVIAIQFFAKVPRYFAWIRRCYCKRFGIFIGVVMEPPFEFAWALPEFDGICVISNEEFSQLFKDGGGVNLKRGGVVVENFPCHVNRIGYNDDLRDIVKRTRLIDTTSDSKQLCL